jgi:hypothetical protein
VNHPLQPLQPLQRLGWLKHFTAIECSKASHGVFRAGQSYPMTSETVTIRTKDRRQRTDGVSEPVTFTGKNILIRVKDHAGDWHRFLENPAAEHPLIHDLKFLVEHFSIPEIQDVATLNPTQFRKNIRKLKALER